MGSRRQIREAAVQLLYCSQLRGGALSPELLDPFWRMVSEGGRRQLLTATLRSIQHFSQGYPERLAEWRNRLPAAQAKIAADPDAAALSDALSRLADLEDALPPAIEALEHISLDGSDDEIAARLEPAVARLFGANRDVIAARRRFLETAEDFPPLTATVEPLAGACRKLNRISERLAELSSPDEELPQRPELEPLRKARNQLSGVRSAAEHFAEQVLDRLETIDSRLESIVDNYSPERLDLVDRSILRLAAWEILFDPEIPDAVAINEALEIAKRFGNTKSARFVNGILDRLAKQGGESRETSA